MVKQKKIKKSNVSGKKMILGKKPIVSKTKSVKVTDKKHTKSVKSKKPIAETPKTFRKKSDYVIYLGLIGSEFRSRGIDLHGKGTFLKLVHKSWPNIRDTMPIGHVEGSIDIIFENNYPEFVTGEIEKEKPLLKGLNHENFSVFLENIHGSLMWWEGRDHFPDIIASPYWKPGSIITVKDSMEGSASFEDKDGFMRKVSRPIDRDVDEGLTKKRDENFKGIPSSSVSFSFLELLEKDNKYEVIYIIEGWNFSGERVPEVQLPPFEETPQVPTTPKGEKTYEGEPIEVIKVREQARVRTIIEALREDVKSGFITKQEYFDMLARLK